MPVKAIVLKEFGGPEQMVLGDVDQPVPGPGQVLIRVAATSVNAPDLVQRQGNYAPPPGESDILGLEVAGTIEQLGEGVSRWREGERVIALVGGGSYAEYAVAWEGHVMPAPAPLSDREAACICETYITAWLNLFRLAGLENGESVLLHGGGGGVNTAAIQLCQQLVPKTRILVTASTRKIDGVRDFGIGDVINYQEENFAERVREITGKRGVDVILDHVGGAYLADNMKSLATYGRLVQIGVIGGARGELNLALMMVKRQQIIGSVLRARSVEEKASIIAAFSEQVMPLFESGAIAPRVHSSYALDQAADAHREMAEGTHFGKIVLTVAGS